MSEYVLGPPAPTFFCVKGKPQTKNKRRAFVMGGKARVVRDKESVERQAAFQAVADAHAPDAPWGGPVQLSLSFYFRPPKSWPAWRRSSALRGEARYTSKPDLSRLVVFAEDCLCGLFFVDDAQVVELQAEVAYSETPRTEVLVTYLQTNPTTKAEAEARLT